MNRGASAERGSGTVLVLGAIAVVLVLLTALLALGGASLAMARARSAADAAALAAGRVLLQGGEAGRACGDAARYAQRGGADLLECRPQTTASGEPRVEVRVRVTHHLPGLPPAEAWARAGGVPDPDASIREGFRARDG